MIPLRDTIRTRTVPFVTRLLVVANVAIFVLEFLQGENLDAFLETFAFIPLRFFHPELVGWTFSDAVVTIFTAMFLHGGLAHLLGAYFVYYPRARIVTVVPLFILFPIVELPAGVYLLGWFALQFLMGSEQHTGAGRAG